MGAVIPRRAVIGAMLMLTVPVWLGDPDEDTDSAAAADGLGVAYWKARFDQRQEHFSNFNLPRSQTADSAQYYDMAYGVDGYVSMFEATGSLLNLNAALELVLNVIADAEPSQELGPGAFGDTYHGWVSQRPDVAGEEVALFESYCWRYVCRLLTALRANKSVFSVEHYRTQYDAILAFTEDHIFDKWYSRGADSYIYRQNTNMAAHWAYIALHLWQHTQSPTRQIDCEIVHDNIVLTGLPNYKSASLKDQLLVNSAVPGSYVRSEIWGVAGAAPQDVSHANGEVAYIVEGRDYSSLWTDSDIAHLIGTLTKVIMAGQPLNVDGTGQGTGWIADGFVKLGRFSAAAQKALEVYEPQGQSQYIAAMAENSRRLGWP